jgi:holo-[acyl-carrier protein] synthase
VPVGLDLVRVQDVADAIARFGDRYLTRVFTAAEIAYCRAAPAPLDAQRFAARIAAKEAARKVLLPAAAGHAAIGATGPGAAGLSWRDVEVWRAPEGGPTLRLHGAAAERARAVGLSHLAVSLTHDAEWAAAVVTAAPAPAWGHPGAPHCPTCSPRGARGRGRAWRSAQPPRGGRGGWRTAR